MTTTPFISRNGIKRRRLLRTALAAGAAVPLTAVTGPAWARPAAAGPVATRLILPEPTGPYPVGTVPLHLVDRSRPDDIAGPGHFRELMATVWYPARNVEHHPVAPWMPAGALQPFLADAGFVWTGTDADGTAAAVNCNGWTVGTDAASGRIGLAAMARNGTWTSFGNYPCQLGRRLFCFANVVTIFWDGFDLTGDASRWTSVVP